MIEVAPDLTKLSHAEKDALILALLRQLAAAEARIAAPEARLDELTRPAKTPDNSSKPPSQGQKPDRPAADQPPRKSRPGVGRAGRSSVSIQHNPSMAADPQRQATIPPHCARAPDSTMPTRRPAALAA